MEIKSNWLEVPLIWIYNNCMMNMKEESFWKMQIQESVSNLYWDFRDSLEDEGGEELNKECKKLEKKILEIVKSYDVSEQLAVPLNRIYNNIMLNESMKEKQQEQLTILYKALETWIDLKVEEHIKSGASKEDAQDFAREEIMESLNFDFA